MTIGALVVSGSKLPVKIHRNIQISNIYNKNYRDLSFCRKGYVRILLFNMWKYTIPF